MTRAEYLARFNERLARREAAERSEWAEQDAMLAACTDTDLAERSAFWWSLVQDARNQQVRDRAADHCHAYDCERCRRILARSGVTT